MILNKFFKSLSVDESVQNQIQSEMVIDNVIGVMSASGGAGTSTIVANVGHILSEYNLINNKKESLTDMVVCVVDFNVFNPMQYQLLGVESPSKGEGLLDVFIKGREHISENLVRVTSTLSLVTASKDDDLYEYFDVTTENVSMLIDYLRDHFDLVIIDLPNQIASPLCYESVKWCSKVFLVWNETIGIYNNTKRIIDFFTKIKIKNKFTHVIFNKKTRTPLDADNISNLAKELKLKMLTVIPYTQKMVNDSLSGTLYVEQSILSRDVKKGLMNICAEITQIKLSNIVGGESNE